MGPVSKIQAACWETLPAHCAHPAGARPASRVPAPVGRLTGITGSAAAMISTWAWEEHDHEEGAEFQEGPHDSSAILWHSQQRLIEATLPGKWESALHGRHAYGALQLPCHLWLLYVACIQGSVQRRRKEDHNVDLEAKLCDVVWSRMH